nr:hypothetical protein [Pandoravirus massiliensis]
MTPPARLCLAFYFRKKSQRAFASQKIDEYFSLKEKSHNAAMKGLAFFFWYVARKSQHSTVKMHTPPSPSLNRFSFSFLWEGRLVCHRPTASGGEKKATRKNQKKAARVRRLVHLSTAWASLVSPLYRQGINRVRGLAR